MPAHLHHRDDVLEHALGEDLLAARRLEAGEQQRWGGEVGPPKYLDTATRRRSGPPAAVTHASLPASQPVPHLYVLDELQSPIPSHCHPVLPYLYVLDELQERRALQLFSLRIGIGGGEGVGQGYPPPPLPLPT